MTIHGHQVTLDEFVAALQSYHYLVFALAGLGVVTWIGAGLHAITRKDQS